MAGEEQELLKERVEEEKRVEQEGEEAIRISCSPWSHI